MFDHLHNVQAGTDCGGIYLFIYCIFTSLVVEESKFKAGLYFCVEACLCIYAMMQKGLRVRTGGLIHTFKIAQDMS